MAGEIWFQNKDEINLAARGIKRGTPSGIPDLKTCKQHNPSAVASLLLLFQQMNEKMDWYTLPDKLLSAYRDESTIESRHLYADAFDIVIPSAIKQIEWVTTALDSNLFSRAGFYPHRKTIHIDQATKQWCDKFRGARFWVKYGKDRTQERSEAFDNLAAAEARVLRVHEYGQ